MKKCIFCQKEISSEEEICNSCGLSQEKRILVDWEIKKLIEQDVIVVDPILDLETQLGDVGLDLRLDIFFEELRRTERGFVDTGVETPGYELYRSRVIEPEKGERYWLAPGSFVLAQSLEYIGLPDFIFCELGGRSRFAKYGLEVHSTSPKIGPGFKGHATFELKNAGEVPIKLYPGIQRVATLMFNVVSKAEKGYRGIFQYQVRILPPKPDVEFEGLTY